MQLLPSHLESIIGKEREICLQHCFLRPCGSAVLWLCGWENQGSPRTESGAGMWALSRSKSAAFLALGEPSFNQGSITVFRIHGGCLCSALISPRALHTFSISPKNKRKELGHPHIHSIKPRHKQLLATWSFSPPLPLPLNSWIPLSWIVLLQSLYRRCL